MLYSYITKNLIGLQDVILKNVEQDKNYIYIYVQMPRKEPLSLKTNKSNV